MSVFKSLVVLDGSIDQLQKKLWACLNVSWQRYYSPLPGPKNFERETDMKFSLSSFYFINIST